MYSPRLIQNKIRSFADSENGFELVHHTLDEVREFTEYIGQITTEESNSKNKYINFTRGLTKAEQKRIRRWIQNEQLLCSFDSGYFETRYAYICDEKGEIYKFQNRKSQDVFDQVIARFEDLEVAIELFILKARQLGMCLSPETKILKSDMTWAPIADINVGDEIVCVDEESPGGKGPSRKMRTGVVEDRREVRDIALRLTMNDGRTLTATPDHRFLIKQPGGSTAIWRQVSALHVGDEIRYATSETWGESSYEDGWMGGLIDGEGSLAKPSRNGVNLGVSQTAGDVLERARKYFKSERYTFREEVDSRKPGTSSKLGSKHVHKIVLSRMDEMFRLIGKTRPSRFIGKHWWDGKELAGKRSGVGWSKIVSVELLPEQRMIDLQTSEKTFIAEGFVSHNSTKTALKFLHRLLFTGHTQAIMSSVQADKSELIARILTICYQRCPWWLVPKITTDRVGKMMGFENGSVLSIQSGMQATGIGQGWTPTLIHISEVGDIPNPKKTLEEGLLRATHPTRKLFQVWEGTGNGNTGWQADKWRALKEDFPLGKARFCPVFLPWPLATDLYPEPDFMKKFPIPSGWMPMPDTRKHVQRCELYIRSTDYLADVMGPNWTMPREQQWFWEFNYLEAVKSRTTKIWFSQMPADDYEALTGKNDSVFAPEIIEVRSRERERKYQPYAITGNSIDDGFEPDTDSIDYDEPRIELHWESHRGMKYDWVLVPLKPFDEREERLSYDKLLVFQPPKAGRDYSMGIDTADGLGKEEDDRAALNLTLSAKGNYPDIQVAELTSNRINPPQMVGFAAAVAAWYGPVCRDPRGVKFCIEQRDRPGDDCQHQLKLMGFSFQHVMTRYDSKVVKEESGQKQGWYSSPWSVPFLMNRFVEAVNNGWYKPNSPWLIAELKDLERKLVAGGKSKLEHRTGKHDDRVRAAAQAYITRHHMDALMERSKKNYRSTGGNFPEMNNEFVSMATMSVGD